MAGRDVIDINITADPRSAVQGLSKVGKSVGDLDDDLDDLGKAGVDAGHGIEKGADDASGGLDTVDTAAGKASTGISGLGDVAQDVLSGDVAGAAQSAGSAVAGLGPIGLAAAGVITVAGGLIGAAFQANADDAAAMAEATETAFQNMVDAGGRFTTAEQERKLIEDAVNDDTSWKNIQAIVEATGESVGEVTRAVALQGPERDKIIAKLETEKQLIIDAQQGGRRDARQDQIQSFIDKLNDQNSAINTAAEKYNAFLQGVEGGAKSATSIVDELNASINGIPASKSVAVSVTADTSALDRALAKTRTIKVGLADQYGRAIQ